MSPARSRAVRACGRGRPAPLGGLLAGLLLVLAVLSGCGSSEPTLPEATRTAGGEVGAVSTAADGFQEITLETGDDYVFTPDTFTDGVDVVVEGRLGRDGTFRATTLLAKCASRYENAPEKYRSAPGYQRPPATSAT